MTERPFSPLKAYKMTRSGQRYDSNNKIILEHDPLSLELTELSPEMLNLPIANPDLEEIHQTISGYFYINRDQFEDLQMDLDASVPRGTIEQFKCLALLSDLDLERIFRQYSLSVLEIIQAEAEDKINYLSNEQLQHYFMVYHERKKEQYQLLSAKQLTQRPRISINASFANVSLSTLRPASSTGVLL